MDSILKSQLSTRSGIVCQWTIPICVVNNSLIVNEVINILQMVVCEINIFR